ncbi:MAG: hypothetical protein BWY89_01921 [Bacteroidetes bacterium ADurb.BinA012]|nr:MAG: hypothetical protein BWY89_01921 [Bacteroidetes bacterium ADurb.BinA012]
MLRVICAASSRVIQPRSTPMANEEMPNPVEAMLAGAHDAVRSLTIPHSG